MAEPRNPFGPNVLPFPSRSQPLGEGGGGFRPPEPMPQQALKAHVASQTKPRGQPEVGFQERRAGQLADQRIQKQQEGVARARAEEGRQEAASPRTVFSKQEYVRGRDVSVFTDPASGRAKLRRGSQSQEFGSRKEALEALVQGWPQGGATGR